MAPMRPPSFPLPPGRTSNCPRRGSGCLCSSGRIPDHGAGKSYQFLFSAWCHRLLKKRLRLAGTIPFPKHLRRLTLSGMPVATRGNPRSSCHHVPSCWAWNQSKYSSLGSGSKLVHFTGRPMSQETQSGLREPPLMATASSSPNVSTSRSLAQLPPRMPCGPPLSPPDEGVGSICTTPASLNFLAIGSQFTFCPESLWSRLVGVGQEPPPGSFMGRTCRCCGNTSPF